MPSLKPSLRSCFKATAFVARKMHLFRAPDYVDQSVWDSVKAPVENVETTESEDVSPETTDFQENIKLKSASVYLMRYKPHYCDKCEKYYWSKDILEHHLKMKHESEICCILWRIIARLVCQY